jgi:hypothetical protein
MSLFSAGQLILYIAELMDKFCDPIRRILLQQYSSTCQNREFPVFIDIYGKYWAITMISSSIKLLFKTYFSIVANSLSTCSQSFSKLNLAVN